jgi:hypothetical protein
MVRRLRGWLLGQLTWITYNRPAQPDTGQLTRQPVWADPEYDVIADLIAVERLARQPGRRELHCARDIAARLIPVHGWTSFLDGQMSVWAAGAPLLPGYDIVVDGDMRPGTWEVRVRGEVLDARTAAVEALRLAELLAEDQQP